MITGIQNIDNLYLNIPDSQKTDSRIRLPALNSLVDIKVIDKISGSYKLLINGSVFQAKFPIELSNGESLLARVISHKPFTLNLNNIFSNSLTQNNILSLINKFDLTNNLEVSNALKKIIDSKKPLIKSKIEKYLEYIDFYSNPKDELLLSFFIQLIWSDNKDHNDEILKLRDTVFDISFEELVRRIYQIILSFGKELRVQFMLEDFFCGISKDINENNNYFFTVEKKIKIISECIAHNSNKSYSEKWQELNFYFVKYVIQMAIFSNYGYYPDFYFIREKENHYCILYYYFKTNDSYQTYANIQGEISGELKVLGYYQQNHFLGIINSQKSNISLLNNLKSQIAKLVDSNFSLIERNTSENHNILPENFIDKFKINKRV